MRQLAWFCLLLMTLSCRSTPDKAETVPEAPPDVPPKTHAVVLIIDTLRADAVNRAHTPTLDRVGTEGQRIAHAWSGGTWTVPSVISIFTGMPVRQHGWDLGSGRIGRYPSFPSVPTMAEVFQEKGFKTTGLYANTYLSEELGFERGFDEWIKVGWLDASRPKPGRFKSYRRRGEERISLVDPEADRRLEALGYLEPTRPSPIAP